MSNGNQKPGMFVPALIGGAVAGALSGLPFINCLCCIWIIGGAMLASYLLSKDSPVDLSAGDGAIIGVLTGIIATVVRLFVNLLPFHAYYREFLQKLTERLAEYTEEMPPGWEAWLEKEGGGSIFMFMSGLMITAMFFAALGALGGIIGVSLFGKKKSQATQGVSNASENSGDRQS
ncbi:MAG: hypothetical protein JSV96_06300 [Candidatus Aminicenantes bacterium]|nr:MAG: hypothetical protein JSV96_06300 [Candidatus Aminicenantes bacterium]